MPRTLLLYTETYDIGGSERFVADVVEGLDPERWAIRLAGNEHPAFERWLADRLGRPVPRTAIPVLSHDTSALTQLRRRLNRTAEGMEPEGGTPGWSPDGPEGRDVLAAPKAAQRFLHAAVNRRRVRDLLQRERPDVLFINNGGYPGAGSCRVAPLAAREAGVGGVLQFVHQYAERAPFPRGAEAALDARIDRATDLWVTAAHGSSARLAEVRGIARDRVRTVHLGQDLLPPPSAQERAAVRAELDLPDGIPALFVVGSLEPRKAQADAVEAFAALRAEGRDLQLVLIGAGPDERALRERVRDHGLNGDVRFLGFRTDVPRLLAGADVLLAASAEPELLPYAIKEAMAHALPAVATAVGGVPELVADGETGFLVPPRDPAALAAATRRVLDDDALRVRLGEGARARLEAEFSMEKMLRELDALLEEAAA